MGTSYNKCAIFKSVPILPYGLTGIFVSCNSVIGENCTILQFATIGSSHEKSPSIGDDCIIGTKANVIGGILVGNRVYIGANCVVTTDIEDQHIV